MKHIKFTLFCLVALLALNSCKKDFLQQNDPDANSISNSFKTENDVLLAVNGCYSLLRSGNTIGEGSDLWTDQRSDDTGTNDNQSNAGEPFGFNNFSLIPTNSYLYTHWLAMYAVIANCNIVLSNIDKVSFAVPATKQKYKAEAEFIRALIYFHMVREWGDVPLVTTQLTSTEDITANTARTKQAAVYTQIVADLKDAAGSPLPATQSVGVIGRISLAAVNTLLGQVYLTMATTQDAGAKTANLNDALTYLTNAYNAKTFGNLSDIPYTDVFDVTKKSTCPELIWQIVNIQGDPVYSSSIAANSQATGETTDSQKPSTSLGDNVTHDLVNEYESGDPRMAFSIKFANAPTVKDWYVTKFRDVSSGAGKNGYGGNDWILMRYADVILMLAETNMYLGNTAVATQYLDMVRTRAGMPTYEVSSADPAYSASFPTLKLAILHERRVELAFEHHRWFDLLRTFTTDELVTYFHNKSQANFGSALLSNFTTKDRFYPIPFNETKLDPVKMYQNPGY
ncbi:RagB/SusD family nutrient uptake outer membrane protein [Mucilaginibacter sp. BJC16-A38]|uniref:RagB/SusD family nutrient uptake outer membrane protein n=1 Tax=Mucilaginibacter phenanthrenivorans TaxID=1234842 RepID=UPI0021578197|nr:RagB/SusD family nutrient uptake outer membrane protein [Mucilaginibacter phenanthrenivorans]MCR8556623.1 RagB/SusD family nutrient uptake outer membrane protein [Mucilaginibacter phenanthrenivorans]